MQPCWELPLGVGFCERVPCSTSPSPSPHEAEIPPALHKAVVQCCFAFSSLLGLQ